MDKRPATGRWRIDMRQRVDAKQTRIAARTKPGRAARDVTGAEHLARHLPNPGAVRPFSLLGGMGLVRWLFFFARPAEADPGPWLLGRVK